MKDCGVVCIAGQQEKIRGLLRAVKKNFTAWAVTKSFKVLLRPRIEGDWGRNSLNANGEVFPQLTVRLVT